MVDPRCGEELFDPRALSTKDLSINLSIRYLLVTIIVIRVTLFPYLLSYTILISEGRRAVHLRLLASNESRWQTFKAGYWHTSSS